MTFGHTGEAHWAELNTASALGSLTAPTPKVKVKVKVRRFGENWKKTQIMVKLYLLSQGNRIFSISYKTNAVPHCAFAITLAVI